MTVAPRIFAQPHASRRAVDEQRLALAKMPALDESVIGGMRCDEKRRALGKAEVGRQRLELGGLDHRFVGVAAKALMDDDAISGRDVPRLRT
jgi:hypothetical protein